MRSTYHEEIECPNEIESSVFRPLLRRVPAVEWILILTTVMSEGAFMKIHVGLPLAINSHPLQPLVGWLL